MAVILGIVLNVLCCGVVTARRITRRPWFVVMNALLAPPLRHRRLSIYQGERSGGPGACRMGVGVERGPNMVTMARGETWPKWTLS